MIWQPTGDFLLLVADIALAGSIGILLLGRVKEPRTLWLLRGYLLLVATASVGLWLWQAQRLEVGVFAKALPLAWQITSTAGWVSWEVAGIFENVGVVQEGMDSIARPLGQPDRPGAPALHVSRGEIRF